MIFITTRRFPDADVARLEARGVSLVYGGNPGADPHGATRDEYLAGIFALPEDTRRSAVGLIVDCFHITAELLDACPNVRWAQHPGAGVNSGDFWTDWALLRERGVIVTTAKIHAVPISEMIVGYMLALSKRLPRYLERQKQRVYRDGEHLQGLILEGRTALILGTGHVGAETARKLKVAFGMTTVGVNSDGRPVYYFDRACTLGGLDDELPLADYVICTSVLVPATRHMIDARRIGLMKPTAYLINPSRGSLIVEEALAAALKARRIAGAALDSYEVEPLPADSPFWDLDNVILTPHVSGGRPDYNAAVIDKLLANLDSFRAGQVDRMIEVANVKEY